MTHPDFWLFLAYGLAAVVLGMVIRRVGTFVVSPKRYANSRDRVMELLHRRLDLEAEIADVDIHLKDEWEKANDPRARVIVETVEHARLLSKRLRQLARNFGFTVPEPPEEIPALLALGTYRTPEPASEPWRRVGGQIVPRVNGQAS